MADSRQRAYRPCTRGLDAYTRWLAHCVCRLWQRHEERVRGLTTGSRTVAANYIPASTASTHHPRRRLRQA